MNSTPILAGAAALLLGLLLPLQRRGAAEARLVAAQGAMVALAAAAAAWSGGGGAWLWLVALGAFAGRALVLPALVRLATERDPSLRAADAAAIPPAPGSAAARLVVGGGLAALAVAAVSAMGAGVEAGAREGLALALATLLAGLLATVLRSGMPSGLLGLLAAENGALLGLVHAGDGLPGAAALAVLSPGLLACAGLALRGRHLGSVLDALPWALPWAPRR